MRNERLSTSRKTEGQTCFNSRESVTLLDGGVEGVKAELVIGDCIGYIWERSLGE